ncbi:hypothetical protein M8818_005232 [Zalaria obscura]|uniref:Uncharacterized protein n=1 Tax=Zalaria obscura TaxID=2024903 RepID=A0ACC3S9X9_9PEZI
MYTIQDNSGGLDSQKRTPDPMRYRKEHDQPRGGAKSVPRPDLSPEEGDFGGCFGLFKRKRGQEISIQSEKVREAQGSPRHSNEPSAIRPGGGGVVPGRDAPLSAVNAGDRKVLVQCNRQSIYLPVTPTTTSVDLINSAANCLSENIYTKSSVLLESFDKAGVQRPLRRYEHVRDVMNSWDDDKQNSLIVIPSVAAGANIQALGVSYVPREKPEETSFLLYYSQKVGSWDKRLITIRLDGQVVMTKKPKDKDVTTLCHLSDFDIYTPTARQASKKIKPPKKQHSKRGVQPIPQYAKLNGLTLPTRIVQTTR